jgi:prepilin-type N-terminal cleavage/methylation domain-containing protein
MIHRGRGFTLIELMVVLGVVSVLALMIVPRFEGTYRRSLLRSTARELAAAIDLASSRAATTSHLHRLRVDPASGEWAIEERGPLGRFEPVSSVPATSGRLQPGIRIRVEGTALGAGPIPVESRDAASPAMPGAPPPESRTPAREEAPPGSSPGADALAAPGDARAPGAPGAGDAVTFRPDGTAEGRELILEVDDGARLALRVHPSTGRVRIIDLGREEDPLRRARSPLP